MTQDLMRALYLYSLCGHDENVFLLTASINIGDLFPGELGLLSVVTTSSRYIVLDCTAEITGRAA